MSEADELFGHKHVTGKKKQEKIPEETVEEEEWYIEDPDTKPDRVAFVKLHKDHDFKTKAS